MSPSGFYPSGTFHASLMPYNFRASRRVTLSTFNSQHASTVPFYSRPCSTVSFAHFIFGRRSVAVGSNWDAWFARRPTRFIAKSLQANQPILPKQRSVLKPAGISKILGATSHPAGIRRKSGAPQGIALRFGGVRVVAEETVLGGEV